MYLVHGLTFYFFFKPKFFIMKHHIFLKVLSLCLCWSFSARECWGQEGHIKANSLGYKKGIVATSDTSYFPENDFLTELELINDKEIRENTIKISKTEQNKELSYFGKNQSSKKVISKDSKINISENQRFLCTSKNVTKTESLITLYDLSKNTEKKTKISKLGFEGNDEIMPLNDGLNFIQDAFSSPSEGIINLFKFNQNNEEINSKITIDRTKFLTRTFLVNEGGKYFLLNYTDEKNTTFSNYIEKVDFLGKSIWLYNTNSLRVYDIVEYASGMSFISIEKDKTVKFVVLGNKNNIVFEKKLNSTTGFKLFCDVDENKQYLVLSNRNEFYTYDIENKSLSQSYHLENKDYKFESVVFDKGRIIGTCYTTQRVPIHDKTVFDIVPKDKVLFIIDKKQISTSKLDISGIPTLHKRNNKIYLSDNQRITGSDNIIVKNYKMTFK